MADLDWLIARPLAHRGLHDDAKGIIENTMSAFAAAVAGRYGIECDLQISSDGEAMVHHDDALGRLTEGAGRLDATTAAELKRVEFKGTADRMITLGELCDFVAGRAAMLIELKGARAGDRRLAARAVDVLSGYGGNAAVMSFEPRLVAEVRRIAPRLARGMAMRTHSWRDVFAAPKQAIAASRRRSYRARNSLPIPCATCPHCSRRSRTICLPCRSSPGRCVARMIGNAPRVMPTR